MALQLFASTGVSDEDRDERHNALLGDERIENLWHRDVVRVRAGVEHQQQWISLSRRETRRGVDLKIARVLKKIAGDARRSDRACG